MKKKKWQKSHEGEKNHRNEENHPKCLRQLRKSLEATKIRRKKHPRCEKVR